jgi:uncharacterized protein YjbI with pentapeptide repeats
VKECDFSHADLEGVSFIYSDLEKSIFNQTNLTNTNFNFASNFSIDPNNNTLKKTKFSRENMNLLLLNLDIVVD